MSEEKEMNKLVNEFLKDVKEKLPEWLKIKNEDKVVLRDLEAHIWDKAEELSEFGIMTIKSVLQAINSMGTPESITKEFKRRGTPKVYITEELWPYYLKTVRIVFLIIIILNVLSIIIDVLMGNIEELRKSFNIFYGLGVAFIIITLIFVLLSMEGYLPDDFKLKKQLDKKEFGKAKQEDYPVSPKTEKQIKPIVKPKEKIAGGICSLIIGYFFLFYSFTSNNKIIYSEFLFILRIAGVLILIDGIITIARGLVGSRNVLEQQITLLAMACLKFSSIILFLLILNNLEIFPILYIEDGVIRSMRLSKNYLEAFANLLILIIIIQIISGSYDIYKVSSLEKLKF